MGKRWESLLVLVELDIKEHKPKRLGYEYDAETEKMHVFIDGDWLVGKELVSPSKLICTSNI